MLKVEGLNAGYGSVNILWDIGFTLAEGEIVAIPVSYTHLTLPTKA